MKKGIGGVFIFLFLLSVLSFVSASCNDDQRLFRMYQENNSHVSVYSDTNYNISICYNELFGSNYSASNPHTCDATKSNVIFWLNASKNSHVSAIESGDYKIPVCYGVISCRATTSDCLTSEVLVVKAYDLEELGNSHVSLNQSEYGSNICCKNALSVKDSFWSDLNGNEVASIELGDSVIMVAKGFEFQDQELNYTIVGETSQINLGAKLWNWVTFRGWQALESWTLISTNEWSSDVSGTYNFNVNVVGTNVSGDSTDLIISEAELNTLPTVNITSNRTINTLVDTPILFNASVYDADDFLNVVWDYSDGAKLEKTHYALANEDSKYITTTHSFTKPGHYVVALTASEEGRPQVRADSVDVYVYATGTNVIPVISSPIDKKNDYGNLIRFDATKSFVANCSTTAFLTGADFVVNGTTLRCKYIHAPNSDSVGASYNLSVEWLIDGDQVERGSWGQSTSTGTIQNFLRYFNKPEYHHAQLSLTYTPN